MARHLSEMLLIVRAQNQASGALRRVGKDLSALGRHRNLQIQQQKQLIQQQRLLRQGLRARNELADLTSGSRRLGLERRALALQKQAADIERKRTTQLRNWGNVSRQIARGQDQLNKISNDQFRRETQRLRLLNRQAKAVSAENALVKARQAMLRKGGGLKTMAGTDADIGSKANIAEARGRMKILDRMLTANAMRQAELAANAKNTNRAINSQIAAGKALGRSYRDTDAASKILSKDQQKLAADHIKAANRAHVLRSELAGVAKDFAIAQQKSRALGKEIRAARFEPISTLGRTVQHLGRVGQYAFLVFGGGLAYAAHQAAQFEKNVTLVATQTGKVDTNFGRTTATIVANSKYLQRAFIGIQSSGTSSMEDINEAAYNLFSTIDQLGDSRRGLGQGTKMLKLFSDAAIAGQTPITDVAEGVIGVLSAFDKIAPTAANVEKILNRMFATVRFGRMSFAELNESLTTLTPAARSAGQTLDTTLGTFAFLSKPLGVAKARVGIPRLMEVLTRPKMVTGLKKLGIEVANGAGKMFQLDKIIGNIIRKRPDITKSDIALMQFFKTVGGAEGTAMARRAFVFLAKNLGGYRRILKKVTTDNNEFKRSLTTMEATTGVRWDKFVNQLRAIALMIGANVLPEILKLAPHIQRLVDWFQQLDPAVRKNAVHIAAMAVAFTGLASAVMFLLGPLIRLAATLAKARLLFVTLGAGFIAVSVAIAVLTGNWHGLNTVIDSFFGLTDRGAWGWIAMFAIATAGALKLAKAIAEVRKAYIMASVAQAAGTGMAGLGGMSGMFLKAKGMSATVKAIPAATAGASKLQKTLFLASSAAMAIPGPLWIAGGAIAAAAAGAYLWKRHMDSVAKKSEQIRKGQQQFLAESSRPTTQAADFGKTGERVINAKKLNIELQRQKLILADLRAQYKTATGSQKAMLGLDIQDALIRVGEYTRMYQQAQAKAVQSGRQLTNTIVSQAHNLDMYKQRLAAIKTTEQQLATLRATPARGGIAGLDKIQRITDLENKLKGLKGGLQALETRAQTTGRVLRTSFQNVIKDLQAGAMLPQKISKGAMDAALRLALSKGRMLTIPEIKAVVKAYADPVALRKAASDIKAAVKGVKVDIQINKLTAQRTNLKGQIQKAMHTGDTSTVAKLRVALEKVDKTLADAQALRKKVAQTFAPRIKQHVDVKVHPANTEPLGAAISQGIARGIISGFDDIDAAISQLQAKTLRAAQLKFEVGSPSRLFEREIGKPIIDGIIRGILNKNKIERTAALAMDLFNGAFLQKKQQKIDAIGDNKEFDPLKLKRYEQQALDALARFKKTHKAIDKIRAEEYQKKAKMMKARKGLDITDLIKDAKGQVQAMLTFNKSLEKLKKRGAPVGLLNDLRALGIDGLKYIKLLANASPAELKKYVRAWNQMQGQVRRSQFQSLDDIKNWKQSTLDQLKDFREQAAQKLLDTWNELHDIAVNNMGPLFQGLEDKVGDGFKSALDEWQSQVDDYRSQIDDLQSQIVEVHESFKQAFGQLFQGDFLQEDAGVASKKEWGVALGFDDLFADLQGQVDRFSTWRSTLLSLASKVPPDLAKELEALGPEALDSLKILDSATEAQIGQYVYTWQQGQAAIGQATVNATKDIAQNIQNLTDVLTNLVAPKPLTGDDIIKGLQKQIGAFGEFEGVLQNLREKGIPEQIVRQLAEMGPDALPYMQALNNMTSGQLQQFVGLWQTAQENINTATNRLMQDQLNMWYSHGANIASAIIAGVASEQQGLLTFFGNLFDNLLKGKMPNMPGTGAGGGNLGPADPWMVAAGLSPTASGAYNNSGQPSSLTGGGSAPVTNVTLGPIYATQNEGLEYSLSRAAFNVRNTYAE